MRRTVVVASLILLIGGVFAFYRFGARERALAAGSGFDPSSRAGVRDDSLLLPSATASARNSISLTAPAAGNVRVFTAPGAARSDVAGELLIEFTPQDGAPSVERVAIEDGKWSSSLATAEHWRVVECRIQGEPAEILDVRQSEPASPIAIDVAVGPGTWVHVVDPQGIEIRTGLRLAGQTDSQRRASHAIAIHPGGMPPLRFDFERVEAPFWLPGEEVNPREWWVQADGTTWSRIPLSAERVDRQRIALSEGADVDVRVVGASLDPGMELHIVTADAKPRLLAVGVPTIDGPVRFSGLPVGQVIAQLTAGSGATPLQLASSPVRLDRDRRAVVELRIPELPPLPATGSIRCLAELSYEVLSDEGLCDLLGVEIVVERWTDELRRSGFTGVSRGLDYSLRSHPEAPLADWRFPDIPPGDYQVRMNPLGLVDHVHVDAGRESTMRLVAPRLAYALIHLVSSDPLLLERVQDLEVHEAHTGARCWIEPSGKPDCWTLVAVPGEYILRVQSAERWGVNKPFALEPGRNAFDIEVARPISVRVELTANGEPREMPASWWFGVQVQPRGHAGSLTSRRIRGSQLAKPEGVAAADFEFDEAGRYELTFSSGADAQPLISRVIDVDYTEKQVVHIELP